MKSKTISELMDLHRESIQVDKTLWAEQRTNIQLVAGDHYNRSGARFWNRLRDSKQVSPEQKLRLTKNHIGRITKIYRNAILSHSPDVAVEPKNATEIQDQKVAEMHQSVWQDIKERHKFKKKVPMWAKDFVEIGEVAVKVFWNPDAGFQVGWEPKTDESGQPMMSPDQQDPMTGQIIPGQMIQSDIPVMSGDLEVETIHGFDLRRDASVKTMDESPFLGFDKMVQVKDLQAKYKNDPDKSKFVQESSQDTYRVFEGTNGGYKMTKGMCKVMEYYFKPCSEYLNGYYYIFTEKGILEEDELPFGIYPILYEGFDEITTSPRHHAIIKQLRPYQIEINRAASQAAMHQITLGDDKVYLLSGSKPSSGVTKPGVRYESITGQAPIISPGRVGDQFFQYINDQIAEMYTIAEVAEELEEIPMQVEPYSLLFRSLKQKKKFSLYSSKFEGFLREVCMLCLRLMKKYANDQMVINATGRNEQVNIPEFKAAGDLGWQIKVSSQVEDIETKFGKQLVLNNFLQYVGSSIDKSDIGKFIRQSPYLNTEEMFNDMTIDYDTARNDILALDRGEYPKTQKYENHDYKVKMLTARTKQPDFQFKDQRIQDLYDKKIEEHQLVKQMEMKEIKQAESEFIPSGGYAVATDFYVGTDKNDPNKVKRLRVPSEALQWLVQMLEKQGSSQETLGQMPSGYLASLAQLQNQESQGSQPSLNQQMPIQ